MKNPNAKLIRLVMIMITLGVMAVSVYVLVVVADSEFNKNSIDGSGSQVYLAESSTIVESRLIFSSDDGEEDPSGAVNITSSDLELVEDINKKQTVGMLFRQLAIPQGATILKAYIQFQVDEASAEQTDLLIQGEATENASTFSTSTRDISDRPRTQASVSWGPPPWNMIGLAGPDQQTPDLSAIVQEIVNQPGWAPGNSLAILVTGSGRRTAEAFDGDPQGAALLHVEYLGDPIPTATPTTKPPPFPSGETIRFAVIGDFGDGSVAEGRVADLIAGWNVDFVITTGDNNYPDGDASTIDPNIGQFYSHFIGNYQGGYGSGSDVNRFWPSLGNHDWHTIDCTGSDCSGAYFDYFTLPGNERFYEVDYGLVHLFALDSENLEPEGVQASSPQADWLRDALAASTACFDVVFFHHAPFSSGSHGSSVYMRWPYQEWGADVVMAGHDHTYERIQAGSFPYFISGAGGASLYNFTHLGTLPPGVESVVRYNADYGAMLVTASANGITYQFYNTSNQLVDELTVAKGCSRKNYLPLLIR